LEILCKFNNGLSSELNEVSVTVNSQGISFHYLEGRHLWSFDNIDHEIFGSDEHILTYDDFTLYIKDDDWHIISEHMDGAKVKRNFSVPFLLGCAIVLFTMYMLAIPVVSNYVADNLPEGIEKGLSSIIVKRFAEKDCCLYQGREQLFEKALTKLNEEGNFDFFVIKMSEPNAFAVPGNIIVFTTGALKSFKTEEEFLGILAHEIQHHKHRHHLRKIVKLGFTTVLWNVAVSSMTGFISFDPEIIQLLIERKYGVQDEKEADLTAIHMLEENGVSGKGLHEFFEQLEKDRFTNTYLERAFSTHPATSDRIEYLMDAVQLEKSESSLYTDEEWKQLKSGCEN
jgi:Zn-dependent protease with chaperone function